MFMNFANEVGFVGMLNNLSDWNFNDLWILEMIINDALECVCLTSIFKSIHPL